KFPVTLKTPATWSTIADPDDPFSTLLTFKEWVIEPYPIPPNTEKDCAEATEGVSRTSASTTVRDNDFRMNTILQIQPEMRAPRADAARHAPRAAVTTCFRLHLPGRPPSHVG